MILHLDLKIDTTLKRVRGFLEGNPEGSVLVPDRK